jgi:uridine kinase
VVFNTALLYEIPVLKKLARPLLEDIGRNSPAYTEARRMLAFLRPFRELDASIVPGESLLREFVGYKGMGKSFLNR